MHFNTSIGFAGTNDPSANDKMLDVTKLKAIAEDKIKIANMMISLRAELCGKRKMLVNKILDRSKLKEFADKIIATQN